MMPGDPDDQDLNREANLGASLAVDLIRHIARMHATGLTYNVVVSGIEYTITVEKLGPTNKADTSIAVG